jgi:hypothetical protein
MEEKSVKKTQSREIPFDSRVLPDEQAKRTQEAEYRILGRTQKMLIENGKDLLAVKADIGHGHFLNWIRSLGISESTAESWMSVAIRFDEIPDSREFETRALYLLSTSKAPESARTEARARASSGEKITEEVARKIRDAHRDREEAERKRQVLQRQLEQTQAEVARLGAELAEKPQVIENPETQAAFARLKEKYARKEEELKQKTERINILTAELRKYTFTNREDTYNEDIRRKWKQACDAFHLGINQGIARMVSPLDAKIAFSSNDWARHAEVVDALKGAILALERLKESVRSQFVDSTVEPYR